MPNPVFDITDGTNTVSLIASDWRGLHIKEWQPTINTIKGGGVFADNPLANSRQPVLRKWDNAIETITLAVSGDDQDGVALQMQAMFDMLERATEYWTSDSQPDPVYLKVRGSTETNIRYAIIHAYQLNTLNNPFAMPFFACKPSTIDGAVLTIERGHWMSVPPGTGECAAISAKQDESFSLTHFNYPNATTDDCFVNDDAGTISTGATYLRVGRDTSGDRNSIGIRFVTVNIPPGATITKAWVSFIASNSQKACNTATSPSDTSCCYSRFYGEAVDDASTFSTYANYAARPRTVAYRNWTIPATFQGNLYNGPDIKAIVQEIVDRPGWTEGNDMGIFVVCLDHTPQGQFRRFASYDHASYDRPQLTIMYITETGQEETCQFATAFVANKQTTNNLTHVYQDDGGAFGANLLNAALPHQILPAVPAVNDAIYFGVQTGVTNQDSSTFNSLIFDIGTPADTMQGDWEYWDGGAWSALPVYDTTSGLTAADVFHQAGVSSVFWEIPYNWTETTVNAVTGWWVRLIVTLGGGVGPTQQNRHIYTVSWPGVGIAETQIGGDIPALGRIEVTAVADDTTLPTFDTHRVIMGTRSDARGQGYTPFINLSDVQTLDGVNVSIVGGTTVFADLPQSATGRIVLYNPAAAITTLDPRVYVAFDSAGNVWRGRYRVFLRCTGYTNFGGAFTVSLSYYSSTLGVPLITTKQLGVSQQADPTGSPFWQILDFGLIDLPIGRQYFARNDGQNKTMIAINVANNFAVARDLWLHDLILMPCDEWYGDFIIPSLENEADSGIGNFGSTLAADSLFLPRKQLRAAAGYMGGDSWEFISEIWRAGSPGEVVLAPRTAQKIYFLSMWWNTDEYWMSTPENGLSVRVHKADRWLGLRGVA